jgi:GNAT superfamily N-acetyltransferase
LPDAGLVRMSKADQAASWSRMIKQSNLRNPVLVASDAKSNIYGFASAGPTRESSLPYEGEVFTLYVAPGWTGQGIGAGLLQAIFRLFSKGGTNGMIIWALADNPSRFFYEAMGGQIVAERQHPMWGKSLREVGYGWRNLDLARPPQRVGRNAEPEPPL